MATFGKTTVPTTYAANGANRLVGSKYPLTEAGTVMSITQFIDGFYGAGPFKVKLAIFDVNWILMAISEEKTFMLPMTGLWVTFNLPTPVTLQLGTYWLCHLSDGNLYYRYDTSTDTQAMIDCGGDYATGYPASIAGLYKNYAARSISIYATYTPTATTPWQMTISAPLDGGILQFQDGSDAVGSWSILYDSPIAVIETPDTGKQFNYWLFDGQPPPSAWIQGNTITIPAQNDIILHTLEAYFIDIPVPTIPVVETVAASSIMDVSAILNGNILSTSENCDQRGFDLGTSPGNYNLPLMPETGGFGAGAFSHQIAGLSSNTIYYYRAKAHNTAGWGYGAELSFTTIATPHTFGKTTIGATTEYHEVSTVNGIGWKIGSRYNNPQAGTFSALFARIEIQGGWGILSPTNIKLGIADINGNLLALSDTIAFPMAPRPMQWTAFPITPITLPAGDYWLLVWVGGYGGMFVGKDYNGGISIVVNEDYGNPSVIITSNSTDQYDIYAGSAAPSPPTAQFTALPAVQLANQLVNFDASSSLAGWDGQNPTPIVNYAWNFGDGAVDSGIQVSHIYTTAGAKTTTLTVTDSAGQTDSLAVTVLIVTSGAAKLVYATGYENAQINPRGWFFDLDPDPVKGQPLSNYISRQDRVGGEQWIEGYDRVTPGFQQRPGSTRCIGLNLSTGGAYTRSEFAVYPSGGGGQNPSLRLTYDEFYLRQRMFFPANWALNSPTNKWTIIFQISDLRPSHGNCPYHALMLLQNSPSQSQVPVGELWAVLGGRDKDMQPIPNIATYTNFKNVLPLGRWFWFDCYMFRHATNGIIKIWVDDTLIFDVSGINTKYVDAENPLAQYEIGIGKLYYEPNDTTLWQRWIDDLEIWDSLPVGLVGIIVNPPSVALVVEDSQTFIATPAGGTAPYSIVWTDKATGLELGTGETLTFTPIQAGDYVITATVTDATGASSSIDVSVTVYAALSVSVSPPSATITVGQTQQFVASPSGGMSPYSYQWYLDGLSITGATINAVSYTPSDVGTHDLTVQVTDFTGYAASSTVPIVVIPPQNVTLTVATDLNGSVFPSGSVLLVVGQSYQFQATPDLGYNFDRWDLGGASKGSSNPLQLTATADMDGKTLTALFSAIPPTPVIVNIAISGNGTTDLTPGLHEFHVGDTITIAAIPSAGNPFKWWQLDGLTYTDNPLLLPVTEALNGQTLTAEFISLTPQAASLLIPTVAVIILIGIGAAYSLLKKKGGR